uniref:Uncharacterized protein n=1 Tax=Rhizophora mucronata TaxID=61149 RepID=A0A2P2QZW0_RHIMU
MRHVAGGGVAGLEAWERGLCTGSDGHCSGVPR